MEILVIILVGYLIGSFPTAIVVSKLFYRFDIREKGSGNMGSTNAFRVMGWKAGVLVQGFDILKGLLAVGAASLIFSGKLPFDNATGFEDLTIVKMIGGLAAVIGHVWTVFGKFRGGKGINTAVGMLVATAPVELAVAGGIFLLVVFASGYISLGSIVAACTVPSTMFVRYNIFHADIIRYDVVIVMSIALALLIVYAHRSNIKRLAEKKENRFEKLRLLRCGQRS